MTCNELECNTLKLSKFDSWQLEKKQRLAESKKHNNPFWDSLKESERFNYICQSTILEQSKRVKYSKLYWHEIPQMVKNRILKGMRN